MTSVKSKRKSLFGISLSSKPKTPDPPIEDLVSTTSEGSTRLRPHQFSPNPIASLYVTSSERNLYLAAMSQLDQPPQHLALWSEPAPSLAPISIQPPLDAHPPLPIPVPVPNSEKLVMSPQTGSRGLMIRDEFKRVDPRATQHALLSLVAPSSMRFTGFPGSALASVDAVLGGWPMGVRSRSVSGEKLREVDVWKVKLGGRAWKQQGHQELDSIRLLLAVFTALGVHGWSMVDCVQIGGGKPAQSHNLLFAYAVETIVTPPLFFAVSLPLPDRVSLISPPHRSTPALISALRSAITQPNHSHTRSATSSTTASGKNRITWFSPPTIKLEGWVHQGVYRFWLDGMRRWINGSIKARTVDRVHPQLLLGLINALSALHFELVASLPLLPVVKGRDILIFASLPSSGLTQKDAWTPQAEPFTASAAPPSQPSTRTESPVLIDPPVSLTPRSDVVGPRHTPSIDSSKPLIATVPPSPRSRNVLLKKTSLRKRHESTDSHRSTQSRIAPEPAPVVHTPPEDQWSMVDLRSSQHATSESGESLYVDAPDTALRLGQPVEPSIPMPPLREPKSPQRAQHIDVGSGVGVPSMRGSVGYFPSVVSAPLDDYAATQSVYTRGSSGVVAKPSSGQLGPPRERNDSGGSERRGWYHHPAVEDWQHALAQTVPEEDMKGKGRERRGDEAAGTSGEKYGSGRTKVAIA